MSDLFPASDSRLARDIDDIQLRLDGLADSSIATVLSYDSLSDTGVGKLATGQNIQFKNWTSGPLYVNTKVLILTKDTINYVVATEETVSGWASTQVVVKRPSNELLLTVKKTDVGKLMITTAAAGLVQVVFNHDLSFAVGQSIDVTRGAAGTVRFLAGGTPELPVTLVSNTGAISPQLRTTWSTATVVCIEPSKYLVVGDIIA